MVVEAADISVELHYFSKAEGDAIEERGEFGFFAGRPAKDAVAADADEQENAVVQVMNVRLAHEKVHVRHGLAHDEKNTDTGDDEGADEAEEGDAREFMRGLTGNVLSDVFGMLRVTWRHRASG